MISGQNKISKDHYLKVIGRDSSHKDKEVEIIKIVTDKRQVKGRIEIQDSSQQKEVNLIETKEMVETKEMADMSEARKDIEKKQLKITKMEEIQTKNKYSK